MEQTQRPEDLIKRYLLGELSATEQTALEDEYFLNRSKYEQLCRIEDELLDSYTRGTLTPIDRDRFERCEIFCGKEMLCALGRRTNRVQPSCSQATGEHWTAWPR